MDEVGARLNLEHSSADAEAIGTRLEEVIQQKEQAAEAEDYEKAAALREEEIQLRQQLETAKPRQRNSL